MSQILIFSIALAILMPITLSLINIKRITNKITDVEILKSYYNKNKKRLSIIGYCFIGYVLLSLLLMLFFPYIKEKWETFSQIDIYIKLITLSIGIFFLSNKQYLSNKIINS